MKYVTSDTYQSKIFGLNTFHLFHHVSSIFHAHVHLCWVMPKDVLHLCSSCLKLSSSLGTNCPLCPLPWVACGRPCFACSGWWPVHGLGAHLFGKVMCGGGCICRPIIGTKVTSMEHCCGMMIGTGCSMRGMNYLKQSTQSGPSRVACKRPRHRHGLEGIPEEEEIGFGGGSSSHGPPRARAGGQNDGLMALLNQLSDMLGQEGGSSRYDSRGFRSAVRGQLKKLCRQYQLKLPPWVDGEGMTVKEFKKRTRWFIEDFMLQQTAVAGPKGGGLGKAKEEEESDGEEEEEEESPTTDGAESPQNKGGTAANTSAAPGVGPPGAAGPTEPAEPTVPAEPCVPGATGGQCDGPSSARIITHMMDNLLDNMETLHPGVREEVAASLCSAGPSGIAGLPAQGMSEETNPTEGAVDGNVAAESSGLNKAPPMEEVLGENVEVKDPREVQSEPPVSPRPMGEEDTEPPTLTKAHWLLWLSLHPVKLPGSMSQVAQVNLMRLALWLVLPWKMSHKWILLPHTWWAGWPG